MGRAGRWLRGLLGGKKAAAAAEEPKKRQRWGSFVKSFREKEKRGEAAPAVARPYEGEEEQNKRAIAVAAATAAVAEAAVAAAQAAAAVVRLTSSGRVTGGGGGKREEWAAVKIQSAFRAYLSRRALRALKGLVKLQALVRGNIVRKQAAETLRCMHALVRVQARARACRALRSDRNQLKLSSRTHPGPATPEKSEQPVRSNARRPERSSPLKRNSLKQTSRSDGLEQDQVAQSSGLRWLDQWMEERYGDNTKSGMAATSAPFDDEKNDKILEIDNGKPHYSSKRKGNIYSSSSPLTSDQLSHSFTTVPDSPSKDSTVAQRSVPSPSSVDMQQSLSPLRFPIVDGCDYGESPQFFSASSRPTSSRRGPFTPAKSECSRSLFSGYSDYPNYMANTQSSKAKVRSQSAPKQRPEFEKLGSTRRVSGGYGLGQQQQQQQSGSALAAGAAQRSASSLHAKFTNKAYPGSGRLDRLGMPIRI